MKSGNAENQKSNNNNNNNNTVNMEDTLSCQFLNCSIALKTFYCRIFSVIQYIYLNRK